MSDYYEILGISKTSTQDEIKASFRKLAREHHPDKGGDKEKFQKIQEAYETLGDSQKRTEYDNRGNNIFNMNGTNSHFDFNVHSFFNSHMQQQRVNKKNNHVYICKITLRDIYYGITKNIRVSRNNLCKECNITCDLCGGHGNVSKRLQLGPIMQILQQPCIKCSGSGKLKPKNNSCTNCNSNGNTKEEKIVEIKIEKGSDSEQHIVIEGWGEQATKPNEISGDLIINVTVLPHDDFVRENLNLIHKVKITLKESLVGKNISIPHFDGAINTNINSFGIINPNKEYTIFNKGLIDTSNGKGHLNIRFEIIYPEIKLQEQQILELSTVLDKLKF